MLRSMQLPRAIAALRRLSTRNAGGWSPRLQQEFPSSFVGNTSAPSKAIDAERQAAKILTRKSRVVCQNWQRFGSCRYGGRCAFAAGHVDNESIKPRSASQRISSKESTQHLHKGRRLNFDGFRCFVAAAPAHVKGGPRINPADGLTAFITATKSQSLFRLMIITSVKHCHKHAVERNSCRRRLRAAVRDAEVCMLRSGRMLQLLSAAQVSKGCPSHLPIADILIIVGEASIMLDRPFKDVQAECQRILATAVNVSSETTRPFAPSPASESSASAWDAAAAAAVA